jgi:hypothetical protein
MTPSRQTSRTSLDTHQRASDELDDVLDHAADDGLDQDAVAYGLWVMLTQHLSRRGHDPADLADEARIHAEMGRCDGTA